MNVVFDWDEHNIDHVAAHGITPDEVEDALLDPKQLGAPAHNTTTERRWAVLGATAAGRILVVIFTQRRELPRVVTARDATDREKRRYHQRGK